MEIGTRNCGGIISCYQNDDGASLPVDVISKRLLQSLRLHLLSDCDVFLDSASNSSNSKSKKVNLDPNFEQILKRRVY